MEWKQYNTIFKYILKHKYFINKDDYNNDILFINLNNFELKCKYFFLFTIDEKNNIIWSCDNLYNDQKTKFLSNYLKIKLENKNLYNDDIMINLKKIIQKDKYILYENEIINLIWCIIDNNKKYKKFYIITDIIYL